MDPHDRIVVSSSVVPFETIECPKCGASASTAAAADGAYTCGYCKTRFRARPVTAAPKPVLPPGARSAADERKKALVSFGAVIALIAMGTGVRVALTRSPPREQTPPSVDPTVTAFMPTPAEPEVPVTATFAFHNRISGYQTSFYVLGFVTNTSSVAIDKPKVTAVLRDAKAAEVASADGYAEGDTLEPGKSAPIKILVRDPPAFHDMTFEAVATRASAHSPAAEGLTLQVLQAPHVTLGTWEIAGKVHNGGQAAARFVNVRVLAYDASEHLVGLDTTYADGESLGPGTDARFRLTPLYDEPPKRFEYSVSAQRTN